jgi:ABC-type sulfate/molybdate transport systems ATPase subunit
MVMQMAYLFPGTVAANVAFGPWQRGEKLAAEQIDALLERVGLPGYQQRDVSNLSGGEAQRVSVARTLANVPEALLLDEPTSALDDISARGIEELVMGVIHERRMTCVIVTHNTAQAHRIADRTMILQAGKLVAIGPTCAHPASVPNAASDPHLLGRKNRSSATVGRIATSVAVSVPRRLLQYRGMRTIREFLKDESGGTAILSTR